MQRSDVQTQMFGGLELGLAGRSRMALDGRGGWGDRGWGDRGRGGGGGGGRGDFPSF